MFNPIKAFLEFVERTSSKEYQQKLKSRRQARWQAKTNSPILSPSLVAGASLLTIVQMLCLLLGMLETGLAVTTMNADTSLIKLRWSQVFSLEAGLALLGTAAVIVIFKYWVLKHYKTDHLGLHQLHIPSMVFMMAAMYMISDTAGSNTTSLNPTEFKEIKTQLILLISMLAAAVTMLFHIASVYRYEILIHDKDEGLNTFITALKAQGLKSITLYAIIYALIAALTGPFIVKAAYSIVPRMIAADIEVHQNGDVPMYSTISLLGICDKNSYNKVNHFGIGEPRPCVNPEYQYQGEPLNTGEVNYIWAMRGSRMEIQYFIMSQQDNVQKEELNTYFGALESMVSNYGRYLTASQNTFSNVNVKDKMYLIHERLWLHNGNTQLKLLNLAKQGRYDDFWALWLTVEGPESVKDMVEMNERGEVYDKHIFDGPVAYQLVKYGYVPDHLIGHERIVSIAETIERKAQYESNGETKKKYFEPITGDQMRKLNERIELIGLDIQ